MLSDAPFVQKSDGQYWHQEDLLDSGVVFSAGTRWNFDIEVDGTSNDATGIFFKGYASNGDEQILGLYYHTGAWHLGYAHRNNEYVYGWDFNELTSPKQSFVVSVFRDGKRISIKNSEGFSQDIVYQPKIFDAAEYLTVGFLSSPKINLSVSNLVVEQLQDPSVPAIVTVDLKEPYTTSFEELDIADPANIAPLRTPTFLEMVLFYVRDWRTGRITKEDKLTPWVLDARAHTGKYSVNVIPGGTPKTKDMIPVTVAALDPVFDISGYETVTLKLWVNTTSNPRKASVHNCDTWLHFYYKTELGESWKRHVSSCGEHVKESKGWREVAVDVDVKGKSTIQFAFEFVVQDIPQADPTVYYLIDDIEITAK
jgi:hypothetical protein